MSAQTTITTSGVKPRAPMRRDVANASPNTASVVAQRQRNSPSVPPDRQIGHSSASKPQELLTSGAPYVGHVQICVVGTA